MLCVRADKHTPFDHALLARAFILSRCPTQRNRSYAVCRLFFIRMTAPQRRGGSAIGCSCLLLLFRVAVATRQIPSIPSNDRY